jgi:glutamate 5-kinase
MQKRLVVVKVGTSSLTTSEGNLDTEEMARLAKQIAQAVKSGDQIIFVTSGAVAAGKAELGTAGNPKTSFSSKPLQPQDKAF